MQPESRKLLRFSAEINLIVKKVGHCRIIKFDTNWCHFLLDRNKLSDKEQVIRIGDPKTADFVI